MVPVTSFDSSHIIGSDKVDKLDLTIQIESSQQGNYFTQPFMMPDNVESFSLSYQYPRRPEIEHLIDQGKFIEESEVNIIDLGLLDSAGNQVGASGSDKLEITISEVDATPGYLPCRVQPGEWRILFGAYKISKEGVAVKVQVRFIYKNRRLLKGDLHTHTLASDGVHTVEELAIKATRNGLDFLAITDHNQMSVKDTFPHIPGMTILPGVEWTHYLGHANFIGVDHPYDTPFFCNTPEEVRERFDTAHERGALITINHPFEEIARFILDMNQLPFDCLEVWNGPMRESNLRAMGLWQQLLISGIKIPISAGSDYHRDTPFIFLGGPSLCVYSLSTGTSDILEAIRKGHSFITFAPNGPTLQMTAGSSIMGETVHWPDVKEVEIKLEGLRAGDVVNIITKTNGKTILETKTDGKAEIHYPVVEPGFVRLEVLRAFLPGLPRLPALIGNPIYFEEHINN
jgi:hypothetical protein